MWWYDCRRWGVGEGELEQVAGGTAGAAGVAGAVEVGGAAGAAGSVAFAPRGLSRGG